MWLCLGNKGNKELKLEYLGKNMKVYKYFSRELSLYVSDCLYDLGTNLQFLAVTYLPEQIAKPWIDYINEVKSWSLLQVEENL